MQLRFLAVHRVPHAATGEEWRALGRSLGSWRLSGVPLFYRHPGAATGLEPCCLCPERGAKRPGHQRPAAEPAGTGRRRLRRGRRSGGGGGGGRVRFDGRAFNSFRCWLAPVAPAAASCWGLQRPSAPTTGVRAAGAPNSCHPAPAQARGIRDAGAGLLKPSTPATGRAWVSKKERLTNFEGGVDLMPKDDSEPARRGCSFSLWSSESLPQGESQWREP